MKKRKLKTGGNAHLGKEKKTQFPMANITLFAQAIGILPKENVKKIVRKVGTDKYCKGYNT